MTYPVTHATIQDLFDAKTLENEGYCFHSLHKLNEVDFLIVWEPPPLFYVETDRTLACDCGAKLGPGEDESTWYPFDDGGWLCPLCIARAELSSLLDEVEKLRARVKDLQSQGCQNSQPCDCDECDLWDDVEEVSPEDIAGAMEGEFRC